MPDELAAMIAKAIFVVSAAMVLCMAKARASEINYSQIQSPTVLVR